MVTIIKNQLLKHLSRFTKNLSPEQISLSALRGSGELQDLTLEEDVLTELLELPGWLRLTSAHCNKATFRIQWTKLKTVPIVLNLDEVHIALEVCVEPRTMSAEVACAAMPVQGKYSYIHKVIDGISVAVNQVQIDFRCEAFTSSVQISRVTVESRTPEGRKGDLRLTRIKSPDTGQLLIFKELEWQSARIEAKPLGAAMANLPPLRLLLGTAHCRIVIKKRLTDCSVVGTRLVFRPEPVAWALTDGQLRAALACAAALAPIVRRATALATRAKAARKVEEVLEQVNPRSSSSERDLLARVFSKYDVRETSYHLLAPRVDLHLCDDPGLGRSEKPSLSGGGALQVTLVSMQADFFPYHQASAERRHWRGYREAATPHTQWLSQALSQFCASLLELLDPRPLTPNNNKDSSQVQKPEEPVANGLSHKPIAADQHNASAPPASNPTAQASPTRTKILQQVGKLMTTCLVLRIDDFTVYKVSTGSKTREAPRPLVYAEKATLPGDAGLLHAEFTHFYYPGDVCFPVPVPSLYVQVSPVRVLADSESCAWLGAFLPHVARALASGARAQQDDAPVPHLDLRLEAIMPKIVLEAGPEHVSQQRDRPKELHICTARANVTNIRESARSNGAGTRADLASILSALRRSAPPGGEFPCAEDDIDPISEQFVLHADSLDDIDRGTAISPELLWRENRSVFCARVEPLWIDFVGARATNGKPAPLLDATPLTAWMCFDDDLSKIWVVARTGGLTGLQVNHYQLLFLLRQLERVSEMMAWLAHDAERQPDTDKGSIVVGLVVPAVELNVVLPSSCPGQESSRDLDSVPLDSSSLQDMKLGSESTMAPSNNDRDSGVIPNYSSLEMYSTHIPIEEMAPPSPVSTINFTGFSSMRRGFNSLVTSIDGALTRSESVCDAASTASSDSERYLVLGLQCDEHDADTAFREFDHGRAMSGVDIAAEVVERSSSPSDHSVTSSCRRRDVSKFSMRARAWSEPVDEGDEFAARESTRVAARLVRAQLDRDGDKSCLAPYSELLEARVKDLSVALNMSTALALSEFIEDEVAVPPMPLEVHITNVNLHLHEDRARSVPCPPPLHLALSGLRLSRDVTGLVRLGGPAPPPPRGDGRQADRLARDNEELRRRLGTMARIADDNRELRAKAEEAAALRQCAHAAQQEAAALLADKQELLTAMRVLQVSPALEYSWEHTRSKAEEAAALRQCAHAAQQEAAALLADKQELLTAMRVLQVSPALEYSWEHTRSKAEEAATLRQCAHAAQQEAAALLADKQELLTAMRVLQVSPALEYSWEHTRSKAEEAAALRQCAHAAQQEAAALLADKQELLTAMRVLQVSPALEYSWEHTRSKAEEAAALRQCAHAAQQEAAALLANKQELLTAMRVLQVSPALEYSWEHTRSKAEEAAALRQCAHAAQQEAAALLADKQELLTAMRVLQVSPALEYSWEHTRSKAEEAAALRQCAHAAQQEAAVLLADKQELLTAMRVLQEQLGVRGKR